MSGSLLQHYYTELHYSVLEFSENEFVKVIKIKVNYKDHNKKWMWGIQLGVKIIIMQLSRNSYFQWKTVIFQLQSKFIAIVVYKILKDAELMAQAGGEMLT